MSDKVVITPASELMEVEYQVGGGWQSGVVLAWDMGEVAVWDAKRMQRATVPVGQWREKQPRDDAGNPK